MGYIGTKPANAALTSADIEDGIITAPKIATDAVETVKVKDLNVTTGKLAADAVTNAKTEFTPGLVIKGDGSSADGKLILNCSQNSHGVGIQGPPHSAGQYFIRIELNNGLAVRTASAELTVSDAPAWTTSAGSLGTIAGDFSGTVATVAATGDTVTYAETTSVLTNASQANCSLNSSTGVITTSDFGGSSTTATTYNFTIRATDAQAQTADRAFSLTSSFEMEGACLFT
jgi:hypothetical protein